MINFIRGGSKNRWWVGQFFPGDSKIDLNLEKYKCCDSL